MLERTIRYRRLLIVASHLLIFLLSFVLAFGLRFDFELPDDQLRRMLVTLPAIVVLRGVAFAAFQLYGGLWRYVGIRDVTAMAKALTLSSFAFAGGVYFLYPGFPRSVLILDWLLCLVLAGGLRVGVRILAERRPSLPQGHRKRRRALVVGAGDVAEALLREMRRGSLGYEPVGLVTDKPAFRGRSLHGVSVQGGIDDIPELCRRLRAKEVVIALETGPNGGKRRIAQRCREAGVELRTVPALTDLLQGRAAIGQLARVDAEELLGRPTIGTNIEHLRQEIAGRRVLVTGAAGSIGSEIARQVARFEPEALVLFDRAESDLYVTHLELSERFESVRAEAVVGDILDQARVREVMTEYYPDLVYHAAAYKHVPLAEAHPVEAIKNNVFGTEVVARASIEAEVSDFVLISTDKAVRPVGIMGMTKRLAELVIRSLAGRGTTFVAVRFGNVLGSNGSVVPLFQRQISTGSPVTVTDPEALRYFMMTSEAVELVLQAGALGSDGEVYILHTGEPIRIGDLANNFIRLSGLEPELEVPIRITGLRPGERLAEEFWMDDEDVAPGPHDKIFVVCESGFAEAEFLASFENLRSLVSSGQRHAATELLREIVSSDTRTSSGAGS